MVKVADACSPLGVQYTYMHRFLLALLLLASPVLFAQKVNIDYDHEADFSRVRRYQWRLHPVFEKNPGLQEKYAIAIQLVQQSSNKELIKRGFQPADSMPDIYLTFFVIGDEAQETRTTIDPAMPIGPMMGPWWGSPYGWYGADMPVWTTTTVENFIEGTLVMDIVDAATSKLLWRAYCRDEIRDMRKRDENIDKAVRKALKQFPPKSKKK